MLVAMIGQKGIPARGGGIETHVDQLSRHLAARGVGVFVPCRAWYVGKPEPVPGVETALVPSLRTKHLDAITHTALSFVEARRRSPDIYHFHGVGPALLSWLPRLLDREATVVFTFHSRDRFHSKWGPVARLALQLGERVGCRSADATIAVSEALATHARRTHGADAQYIPNGVESPGGPFDPRVLQRWSLTEGRYVLFVGRLVRQKQVEDLIQAWRQLAALPAEWRLAIVGDADQGAYGDLLRREARGDESIVFTGLQTGAELASLLAGAAIFVSPTRSEGASIAVLEALANGVPTVLSDIPENRAVAERWAIYFEAGDPAALAAELSNVMADLHRARARATQARDLVLRRHNWGGIADRTKRLYSRLRGA